MFTKKWKSDIYNRMIHIEGKEDRIEEKINNSTFPADIPE